MGNVLKSRKTVLSSGTCGMRVYNYGEWAGPTAGRVILVFSTSLKGHSPFPIFLCPVSLSSNLRYK